MPRKRSRAPSVTASPRPRFKGGGDATIILGPLNPHWIHLARLVYNPGSARPRRAGARSPIGIDPSSAQTVSPLACTKPCRDGLQRRLALSFESLLALPRRAEA